MSGRQVVLDRIAGVVERVTPLISFILPPVGILAGIGAASALVVIYTAWQRLTPSGLDEWVLTLILAAGILIPTILLGLFWFALHEVRELPDRLRGLPDAVQRHRTTLSEVRRDIGSNPRSNRGWLRSIWRVGRTLYESKDDVLVYVPLVELLNPIFLLAVLASVPLVLVELALAAFIVISRVS